MALAELLPAAKRQVDRLAVVGAREEVAGLFHRARTEAIGRGGSTLFLFADSGSVALLAEDSVLAQVAVRIQYGVEMVLSRDRSEAQLSFDPLGLGRVASQTVLFRRGGAEAGLVVSSYGRVTRR
jgi:hypothetical protein